jgi:hypothetical protein
MVRVIVLVVVVGGLYYRSTSSRKSAKTIDVHCALALLAMHFGELANSIDICTRANSGFEIPLFASEFT